MEEVREKPYYVPPGFQVGSVVLHHFKGLYYPSVIQNPNEVESIQPYLGNRTKSTLLQCFGNSKDLAWETNDKRITRFDPNEFPEKNGKRLVRAFNEAKQYCLEEDPPRDLIYWELLQKPTEQLMRICERKEINEKNKEKKKPNPKPKPKRNTNLNTNDVSNNNDRKRKRSTVSFTPGNNDMTEDVRRVVKEVQWRQKTPPRDQSPEYRVPLKKRKLNNFGGNNNNSVNMVKFMMDVNSLDDVVFTVLQKCGVWMNSEDLREKIEEVFKDNGDIEEFKNYKVRNIRSSLSNLVKSNLILKRGKKNFEYFAPSGESEGEGEGVGENDEVSENVVQKKNIENDETEEEDVEAEEEVNEFEDGEFQLEVNRPFVDAYEEKNEMQLLDPESEGQLDSFSSSSSSSSSESDDESLDEYEKKRRKKKRIKRKKKKKKRKKKKKAKKSLKSAVEFVLRRKTKKRSKHKKNNRPWNVQNRIKWFEGTMQHTLLESLDIAKGKGLTTSEFIAIVKRYFSKNDPTKFTFQYKTIQSNVSSGISSLLKADIIERGSPKSPGRCYIYSLKLGEDDEDVDSDNGSDSNVVVKKKKKKKKKGEGEEKEMVEEKEEEEIRSPKKKKKKKKKREIVDINEYQKKKKKKLRKNKVGNVSSIMIPIVPLMSNHLTNTNEEARRINTIGAKDINVKVYIKDCDLPPLFCNVGKFDSLTDLKIFFYQKKSLKSILDPNNLISMFNISNCLVIKKKNEDYQIVHPYEFIPGGEYILSANFDSKITESNDNNDVIVVEKKVDENNSNIEQGDVDNTGGGERCVHHFVQYMSGEMNPEGVEPGKFVLFCQKCAFVKVSSAI